MPSQEEFKSKRPAFTVLLNGYFGSGKSLQAHSFPKCYTISCDPAGLETLRQPRNAKYLANLVWYEELHNENERELKRLFKETSDTAERTSIYGCLAHCKSMASKGEVETLVIDGFTYLVDMVWQKINEFEEVKSANTGNRDSQAMYRNLGLYLQRFVASDLLTMATRNNLNVILTCHLKRESEEAVQGGTAKNRARKVALNSDIAPLIEGGFRNKAEGMFGASIYLDKKLKEGNPYYEAICDVATGLGTVVLAKNRYGLAPRVPLTTQTLYEALTTAINGSKTQPKPSQPVAVASAGIVTTAIKPTPVVATEAAKPKPAG